jgi:predicted DNA-binding protein (MmcQ/YjbR family)
MKSEFIRDICLQLPGVREDIKWGHDLCFLVGEKMFCVTGIEGDFGVSIKVKDDEFDELTARHGIIPAPYLARYKWIYLNDPDSLSNREWKHYLTQSYELVKSKLPTASKKSRLKASDKSKTKKGSGVKKKA